MAVLECVAVPPVNVTQRKGTYHLKGILSLWKHMSVLEEGSGPDEKGLEGLRSVWVWISLYYPRKRLLPLYSNSLSLQLLPSNSNDNRSNSQQQKKVIAMDTLLLFILCQGLFYASVISVNVIVHKVAMLIISIYKWGNQGTETLRAQNHMVRRRTGTQSRLHAGTQEALLSSWALAIALHLLW